MLRTPTVVSESLWAVVLLLSNAFCVLCILRYDGMKRPGLTLHDIVHETCSTLNMQLVLHKWLCGCLSLPLEYRSNLQRALDSSNINVVVLVRKLDRHLLKPKPCKIC